MKKLYLIGLLIVCLCHVSPAQYAYPHTITFDATDTLWHQQVYIDTINYHHNQWQVGKPVKTIFDSAYSLSNALVTDTANLCVANDTSIVIVSIPGNYDGWWWVRYIEFYFKMDIDTAGSRGFVDISKDSVNWYPLNHFPHYYDYADTPNLSSSTTDWAYYAVICDFGICSKIELRFTYVSDTSSVLREGWMIDNIYYAYGAERISSVSSETNILSIFPNPAKNDLSIHSKSKMASLAVINLLGQVVMTEACNSNTSRLDITNLPPGLYSIRTDDGGRGTFVKK